MPRALWTGASGMAAQQTNVDVIANNIANVNTNGFKRQTVNFQDLFYDVQTAPGTKSSDDGRNPTGTQIGYGTKVSATPRIFTNGNIEITNVSYDMAIEGDGFFEVTQPDGSAAYTRAGDFRPDGEGNLTSPDGYFLEPRITIPADATQVTISTAGVVTVLVNNVQSDVGTISLARFRNPSGLIAAGRNLFTETIASGAPIITTPGTDGTGTIRGGALEKANVEIVTELVNLIVAQRAFELNSRSITTSDQMLQSANELVR
jgi:flagellar basal-body rod protein FlgG